MKDCAKDESRAHIQEDAAMPLTIRPLVLALCLLISIGKSMAAPASLIDSGVWSSNRWPPNVYWLDNERVMFPSSEDMTYRTAARPTISIWRIGEAPTLYKKDAQSQCYQSGVHWYWQMTPGTREVLEFRGRIGHEVIYVKPAGQSVYADRHVNCGYVDSGPFRSKGRLVRLLLPAHGHLDLGGADDERQRVNGPVTYFAIGADVGKTLPMTRLELQRIGYFEFRDAYFAVSQYVDPKTLTVKSPWPRHLPQPLWWIRPDGEITQVVLPARARWNRGGSVTFVPVKTGVAVVYHGGTSSLSDPGDQGLYLARGRDIEKLLDGFVEGADVSPDGCQLAFAHSPNMASSLANPDNRRTLKVLNVCN